MDEKQQQPTENNEEANTPSFEQPSTTNTSAGGSAHGVFSGIPKTAIIFVVLVVVFFAAIWGVQSLQGNADYICTRIIEDRGQCSNGTWSDWETTGTSYDTSVGATTTQQQRVYTGTRTLRHTISYLNRRTSCQDGYTQERRGDSSGASGFMEGEVVTVSQVCQIEERRSVVLPPDGSTASSQLQVVGDVTSEETTGDTTSSSQSVSGFEEINAFRRAQTDLGLFVNPSLVRHGDPTTVKWTTVEMTECTVTADENNDTWSDTAGEESSSPITEQTTYTLSCTDFEGNPHTEEAVVNVVPRFEEI